LNTPEDTISTTETPPSLDTYNTEVQLLKVLSHPVRLAILDILREGEYCVCHIETHLGCRQSYISQQLALLRSVGLIQDRREGWNIFYRVSDPRVYAALDAIQTITGGTIIDFHLKDVDCPCPKCQLKK
jgi:DNA-binding transcriptional ArsR family regulator